MRFKRYLCFLLVSGLVLLCTPAWVGAEKELNYNYVQGQLAWYPSADLAKSSQDYLGIDMRGSYQILPDYPEFFAFGELQYLTDDADLTNFHFGGAYRGEIHEQTDFYGGLTIEYTKFDWDNGDDSDIALGLRGGVRHILTPDWELGGQLRLITGDYDYVGLRGNAQYALQENLGLVMELDLYDGELGFQGGVRYNF